MPASSAPSMASKPRVAEIARVSTSSMSSGSAPDWISIARLLAHSTDSSMVSEALLVMMPWPPVMT